MTDKKNKLMAKDQFEAIIKTAVEDVWHYRRSMNPIKDQTDLLVERLWPLIEFELTPDPKSEFNERCETDDNFVKLYDPKPKMTAEILRHDFHNEECISWENSQGEPDIEYVWWLENKLCHASQFQKPVPSDEFPGRLNPADVNPYDSKARKRTRKS